MHGSLNSTGTAGFSGQMREEKKKRECAWCLKEKEWDDENRRESS